MRVDRRSTPALAPLVLITGLWPWLALPARAEPQLTEASTRIDGAFEPLREPPASKLERLSYTYGVELAPDRDAEARTGPHQRHQPDALTGDKDAVLDEYVLPGVTAGPVVGLGATRARAHWRPRSTVWTRPARAERRQTEFPYHDPRISESGIAVAIRAVAGGIDWLVTSIQSAKASMPDVGGGSQASLPDRGFYFSATVIAIVAGLGIQGLIAMFVAQRGRRVRRRG